MNCIQFEEKVQLLLDERLCLNSDPSLKQHALQCGECHSALNLYNRISELNRLEVGPIKPAPKKRHSGKSRRLSTRPIGRYAAMASALVVGFILAAELFRVSTPMAKSSSGIDEQPAISSKKIEVETDGNWKSPFDYEISIRDLIPEWTLQLSDAAYVDLPAIDELSFITLVPEGPVRAVQSIPNTLAPIYYYSVELPVVNRLSDQIYCTISLIQTSFGLGINPIKPANDDLGVFNPWSWNHLC